MGPESRHSVAVLTRLRQEISEDREAMLVRLTEMDEAASLLDERPWASHAGVALHGWYTALEVDEALDSLDDYLANTIDSLTTGDS